ncbi:L-serine ammonia-lyase [Luteolibacter sp. GHJ8]|uniref:L-serine dehydratase n=1 Tax=Luteolibacter rhizosphaerae TaxID=2989719 RepID=A0ABT3G1H7_9BACT|nr:L-serine ammonia-lyase [Luteolibacter rhizosphaerae]MCW1913517.1 L-serine ammonia-lyase [Luteolibacter rhizosphaerae]
MTLSALDLFTIGVGPSSSHTVGPMRAASRFVRGLVEQGLAERVSRVRCDLYGSLAATGKGHGTDSAILLGFLGEEPETVEIDSIPAKLAGIRAGRLLLPWGEEIEFDERADLDFKRLKPLPLHPNGMHFTALDAAGSPLADAVIYSLGGGFIASEAEMQAPVATEISVAHPFTNAAELMAHCENKACSIATLLLENEAAFRPEAETRARLNAVWQAMQLCVKRGCSQEGTLPGGLKVKRRAKAIFESLCSHPEASLTDPLTILDWVNLYALAVNEENAAGGRVVTAPTNGAAGIIPAVLHYAYRFRHSPHPDGVHRFLLTAAAIGMLYKRNASISGAEAGCQGEVGVACSMAAAGLVEYLGGTPKQVENAAEIGMEHNLGLTCDPVGGLVQIPCIERNAMASVKAINAARLAMAGDGSHFVSLDKVIKTMRDTGRDMKSKYKETSRGGLAVNVVEC